MAKAVSVGSGDFDVSQVFEWLESSTFEFVEEVKAEINETFNKTKESWLVGGLFEYYLNTGSTRCGEILCGISKEPHDKFLIDKITEGIRSPSKDTRKQTLAFFGQVVSKQPSWLYKITQLSLFKELIRLLKTETDVVVLLTGVLTVIMIIPTLPTYIHLYIPDVFDVFGRIATWAQMSQNIPKEHVLHLQVGLYSLFHRLYAMYPCNFLSYLRHNFGTYEKRTVFLHTVLPMLQKVKMHPGLVTATKEGELLPQRWRSREYHDIIAECSKVSLDVYESSFTEEVTPTFARLSSVDPTNTQDGGGAAKYLSSVDSDADAILKLPASTLISQAMRGSDLTSLISYLDESCNTAPPTPLSVTSTGPTSANLVINKTTSPPETAMEATPDNTPIKDKERLHFRLPPTSPAATALQFANMDQIKDKYSKPLFPQFPTVTPTPFNSVPSSPLPMMSSTAITATASIAAEGTSTSTATTTTHHHGQLLRRDSIFDSISTTTTLRRDSLIFQRLQKVQLEQLQHQHQQHPAAVAPVPTEGILPRKAPPPAPITIPSASEDGGENAASSVEKDRSSITSTGPLTPLLMGPPKQSLDPVDLDEDKLCQTSTCSKGGLHMADHKQMIAFAKRVSRLRFHSQCVSGSGGMNEGFSDKDNNLLTPSATTSSKSSRLNRSFSLPNIQSQAIQEEGQEERQDGDRSIESTILTDDGKTSMEPTVPEQPPQLYDELFQKILPSVLSPPVDSRTIPSPHVLLDWCLLKAASLHNVKSSSDDVAMLRGQIALLHGQLLFERHRREAHALRNRRLAGKCRDMQTLEEKNNSMRREIHNLEKEIILLKQDAITQRTLGLNREKDMQHKLTDLERKLDSCRLQISDLHNEKLGAEANYRKLSDDHCSLRKESDEKNAHLFSLENEIRRLQKYLEMNESLKNAYEVSQKEIILLGELVRYHQERASHSDPLSQPYLKEEMEDLKQTCEEEIRSFKNVLENKMSQCEAFCGMIQDLEKKLEKREAIIMEQKQMLQDAVAEYIEQLKGSQDKYESIKGDNHKLELEILNLQHQLTLKSYSSNAASRGRIASSPSNGEMSPTGNSNHSDVDSATSAAGYQLSPERCIFGSPDVESGAGGSSISPGGTRRKSFHD